MDLPRLRRYRAGYRNYRALAGTVGPHDKKIGAGELPREQVGLLQKPLFQWDPDLKVYQMRAV